MTELTCKILTEKYMYQKMWIYTILEYTLSNLLKYSLLTIDIKKCTTKKKKKKYILTDRKSLLTIIIADNIDFEHGEMSKIKTKKKKETDRFFYKILYYITKSLTIKLLGRSTMWGGNKKDTRMI